MAKMSKDRQEKTAEASSDFDPVEDGIYHLRLLNVDDSRSGGAGPYWSWEFEVVEPGEFQGRKLWNNTSLSDSAAFKMKETYDAFGAEYDVDTDDLCGQIVKGAVSTRTIEKGQRAGQIGNNIDRLMPPDEDFDLEAAGVAPTAVGGGSAADDDIV